MHPAHMRPSYRDTIVNLYGLVGYWRLNETSGTVAKDETGRNDGAYVGTPTLGARSIVSGPGGALDSNGSSQYVTIPDSPLYSLPTTNKLSVIAWHMADTNGGDRTVVGKGTAANYEWALFRNNTLLRANIWNAAGTQRADATGAGVANGVACCAIVTMDDDLDTLSLLLDGGVTASDTTWGLTSTDGSSPLEIGRRPDTVQYFDGATDEVAILNRVLTITETGAVLRRGRGF